MPASLKKLALEQLNRPNSAVSHKCSTATLLSIFGLSHTLQVCSFALNLSALHLNTSKTPCRFLVKYLLLRQLLRQGRFLTPISLVFWLTSQCRLCRATQFLNPRELAPQNTLPREPVPSHRETRYPGPRTSRTRHLAPRNP